ncbi:hypothetical protein SAMN05518800_6903 [Variovorax sp. YR752]|uniref:hypothetical protein n=1 Tax=unclassified Variovorax TaxID=663243 RepID=UPI000BD0708F|nr:hypothetical protein [Variovorax sp. YR752]SOE06266.1 hypothetical protein SAMN05518800_6903 [Variovorax sp. YR752]
MNSSIQKLKFLATLLALSGFLASPLQAQTAKQPVALRLDAPVTPENSVPVKFAEGVVLRVPRFLMERWPRPKSPTDVIEAKMLSFPIWYPDMTLASCFGTQCGPRLPTDLNDPNYESDKRFKIMIFPMQYSSDEREHRDSRPSDILENKKNGGDDPTATPSGFKNLNQLDYRAANLKRHPDWKNYKPAVPSEGGLYVNSTEKEGDFLMSCDSHTCDADTYDKTHHFQMRLLLLRTTPGVISQTNNFVHALNQMIRQWRDQ